MTVTEVKQISRTKSRVYLEDKRELVLYNGELRRYNIAEMQEMAEEDYKELVTVILPGRAKKYAMHLLMKRDYTEKQLQDKLVCQGYSLEIAGEAVSYVRSYRYVDDFRYAENFVSCYIEKKSFREIEQKLMQKGISRDTIKHVFQKIGAQEDFHEEEVIKKISEKKHFSFDTRDTKEKQKIFAYFCRKGFSVESIRRAMGHSC